MPLAVAVSAATRTVNGGWAAFHLASQRVFRKHVPRLIRFRMQDDIAVWVGSYVHRFTLRAFATRDSAVRFINDSSLTPQPHEALSSCLTSMGNTHS